MSFDTVRPCLAIGVIYYIYAFGFQLYPREITRQNERSFLQCSLNVHKVYKRVSRFFS